MKNKILVLIFTILIASSIIKNDVHSNDKSLGDESNILDSDSTLYIIDQIPNFKSCIVNDKSEIIYTSYLNDEAVDIINDEYTKKQSLIRILRQGEYKITKTVKEDGDEPYIYESLSRRYIYYDKFGNHIDMHDNDILISYIYNNYAIENNHNYDEIAKIFDLEKKQYLSNDIGLHVIECENNILFGKKKIFNENNKQYKYFLLDNDMSIIKEITSDEYEDLNGKKYEYCTYSEKGIVFGIKHNLRYILNEKHELLSTGYDCDIIGIANFSDYDYRYKPLDYKYDYNDFIFYRIKNNQLIYFTLEKDIYKKTINCKLDEYGYISDSLYKDNKVYNRQYSDKETFVVGGNNCYAFLDDKYAYVYSLDGYTQIATVSSLYDNRNNLNFDVEYRNKFYVDDIYICGEYVLCNYYDNISRAFISYVNHKNGIGYNVLNKKEINKTNPKRFIEYTNEEAFRLVIDVNTQKTIKTLYNKYIDMIVYENEGNIIIALQKEYDIDDDTFEHYDLYDKNFNLLYANVDSLKTNIGLLSFERYKLQDTTTNRNDGKLYTKYITIINYNNDILFECEKDIKDGVAYSFSYSGFDSNIGCVVARHYKQDVNDRVEKYEELFDSKRRKLFNIEGIKSHRFHKIGDDTILFIYTQKETYVYKLDNGRFNLIKKLDDCYEHDSNSTEFFENKNIDKVYYKLINENNNLYSIFDKDFNIIGKNYKYIGFGNEYYYYLNGFKIHICDLDNNEKAIVSYFNSVVDE